MSTLRTFSSAAANLIYEQINAAQSPEQLDDLAKLIWRGFGEGAISDADAATLDDAIRRRRPPSLVTAPGFHRAVGPVAGRIGNRFKPRKAQRSPDRAKSVARRRTLAASSSMPPALRATYTEGERAALCVIAGEVKRHGLCDWPLDKIAAVAGVSRSTVQNALHEAVRLRHVSVQQRPVPGRRNLPNVVTVTSGEWREWIRRAPSAAKGLVEGIGSKTLNPTKNIKLKQEDTEKRRLARYGALEGRASLAASRKKESIEEEQAAEIVVPPTTTSTPVVVEQSAATEEGGGSDIRPTLENRTSGHPTGSSPPHQGYQPELFGGNVIEFDLQGGKLPPEISGAVRREYRARGISQGQFATAIGLSQAQLCNVLAGRFGISPAALKRLNTWLREAAA